MESLSKEYQRLNSKLVNPGYEETKDEVMWNDLILISMDELLKDVNPEIANQIRLNLI